MTRQYGIVWISFIICSIVGQGYCQIDYYSSQNCYKFAEYLFDNNDYSAAAEEYLRSGINSESEHMPDSLLYRIGQSYQMAGDYEKSRIYFQQLLGMCPASIFHDASCYRLACALLEQKKYKESLRYIDSSFEMLSVQTWKQRMHLLAGLDLLYSKQWKKADAYFVSAVEVIPATKEDSISDILHTVCDKGVNLHYKSPAAAAVLSGILPGAGKVYAGRAGDGLISFLVVSLSGWQAYQRFASDGKSSVPGWIFGCLAGGFYLGNIYGSAIAVKMANEKQENALINKIEVDVHWDLKKP
jgi:tetratricopeptide (TPR) repeat protein